MGISKLNPYLQGQLDRMNALMLHVQLTQQRTVLQCWLIFVISNNSRYTGKTYVMMSIITLASSYLNMVFFWYYFKNLRIEALTNIRTHGCSKLQMSWGHPAHLASSMRTQIVPMPYVGAQSYGQWRAQGPATLGTGPGSAATIATC